MRPVQREEPASVTLATLVSSAGNGVTVDPLCGVPRKTMPAMAFWTRL
jgi:hypothetical protein